MASAPISLAPRILPDQSGELEAMRAIIAKQQQMIDQLARSGPGRKVSMRVSDKTGALIVNIGSRYPVTLYRTQWERLLSAADEIKTFILDHAAELSVKE